MKPEMMTVYFMIGIIALLIGLAFIIPSNMLTGHIIKEGTCKELGCVELCDYGAGSAADNTAGDTADGTANTAGQTDGQLIVGQTACKDEGTTCCFTHWNTGVCDYDINCEKIREYSLYQTLDQYKENVNEKPAQVDVGFKRFFFPLIIIFGIIAYFTMMRNDKTRELK